MKNNSTIQSFGQSLFRFGFSVHIINQFAITLACLFFKQLKIAPASLLDLKLSITLTNDPSVVQLAAWTDVVEKGQEVPPRLLLARSVITKGVDTGVLEAVRDLKVFDLLC